MLILLIILLMFSNANLLNNETSSKTYTTSLPLLCAATNNDVVALQQLLKLNEDINQLDECGQNALHWATYSTAFESAQLLLEGGININSSISTTLSPLFCASSKKLKNFMQLYLTYGADFNQPERDDISLLKHLISQQKPDFIQELVNHGHWHPAEPFIHYQKKDNQTTLSSLKQLSIHALKTCNYHLSLLKAVDIQKHYYLLSELVEYYTYYVSFNEKLIFFKQLTISMSEQEIKQLATLLGMCHAQRYEKKWQELKIETSLPLAINQSSIASNMAQSFNILLTPRPAIKDSSSTS
ncbi:hypothetical protein Noda2021_08790 [Candidatus Dependentiae bacterium Noda2021]|nr:hypothetical protein Noda2021_08790 [Candidatus Dependentiae bacterium Noda2021]